MKPRIDNGNRNTYIYKITNLINNKIYIGQYRNSQNKFHLYWGGGQLIKAAIKKYGRENFKKEIIVQGDFSINLTNDLEKHYIRLYNSTNLEIGYNLTPGGDSILMTPEIVEKIRKANTGRIVTEETRNKLRLTSLNKKHSEKTKQKMVNAWIERKKLPKVERSELFKKVYQVLLSGEVIKEWSSVKEAGRILKISNISSVALNKFVQAGGYIWVYNLEDIDTKIEQLKNNKKVQYQSNKSLKLC